MAIIYGIYGVMILGMVLASLFIVFHILRYSYNKASGALMFLVFTSVIAVLLFTNFIIFSSLKFENLISIFNI